jgi:hypothetical protein
MRWELEPEPSDSSGQKPLNVIGLPAAPVLAPTNSPVFSTTYANFAPRIGLAYQLRQASGHETVLRGGFGIFYDLNSEGFSTMFDNEPFFNFSATFSNLAFPVADGKIPLPPLPGPITFPLSPIAAIDPHLKLPYTMQWNVSIEQGLGQSQSLTASYVASAGRRLLRTDTLEIQSSPEFLFINAMRNASSSSYQSLQLQFQRRLSHGLQALAAYTYSHSIDNASDGETALYPSVARFPNPNLDRGSSDFDLRHAFRAAVMYNVPEWKGNHLSRAVFGGWSVDAIGLAQSGPPEDLLGGFYFPSNCTCYFQLRPNVVPGQPYYLDGAQCAVANGGTDFHDGKSDRKGRHSIRQNQRRRKDLREC